MPKWTKEQQSAIDLTGSNIIVSAGAGSGKTAVLTSRVGRILSQNIHINQLLILTFTKAAAEEMKERIRKYLKQNNLQEELQLIDSAYITTFDSFALSVVRRYHYLLNISNNINITDNSIITIQKKQIMEQVFNESYELKDLEFMNMINTFCIKDDKNVIQALLKIANKLELLPNRKEYLTNYITNNYNSRIIDEYMQQYFNLLKSKINEIKVAIDDFQYLIDSDYYHKLEGSISNLLQANSIDEIIASIHFTLPSLPKGTDSEAKEYKENRLAPLIKNFQSFTMYGNEEKIRGNLLASQTTVRVIVTLLTNYFQKLDNYKQENEIYDFQDIALLAIKIVADYPEAREELKQQFQEIMIDEYQDTNDIQETFINYIANNNVYTVGDIKQSIYRFRNANPYIFKNKYDKYSKQNGGLKIDLLKNFRSRSEVLNNVNLVFSALMDNVIGGADYIASHQMIYGNMAYSEEGKTNQNYDFEILKYPKIDDYSEEEIEIFSIAQDILTKMKNHYQIFDKDQKILRNVQYSDFAILLDRATSFTTYKKVFEYLNIPLAIYKDEKLNESIELLIIKNALIIINCIVKSQYDVHFKYAFTSLARSFLYEFSDEEIFNIFMNKNFFQNKVYQDFQLIAYETQNKNIKQIIEKVIKQTNYYQKLIKVGDIDASIARINNLLTIADNMSLNGQDMTDFIQYLDTVYNDGLDLKYSIEISATDSVKLMTIHKSKGLEFPICYFSGLTKKYNIDDLKDRFLYNSKYGLIVPVFDEGITDTIIKELARKDYLQEEISEKIRLFYVAFTRAKEKIIVLLPENAKTNYAHRINGVVDDNTRNKYRSFADMLYSIENLLTKYTKKIDIANLTLTKDYLYPKELTNDLQRETKPLNVTEIQISNEAVTEKHYSKKINQIITKETFDNLQLGLQFHATLEYIDFFNYHEDQISNKLIARHITEFLQQEIMQNLASANIYREHEFIYEKDNQVYHGIIDLMLEYQDHIDIIDYKLKKITDDKYLNQLSGYQEYITNLTHKKTNIYLYSILNNELLKLKNDIE